MNVVYVVVRCSDTGDHNVLTAFTNQQDADDFADGINQHESPEYSAYVDAIGVDFADFVKDYKSVWENESA